MGSRMLHKKSLVQAVQVVQAGTSFLGSDLRLTPSPPMAVNTFEPRLRFVQALRFAEGLGGLLR